MTNPTMPPSPTPKAADASVMKYPMATLGALVGAFIGAAVTYFAARQGFYAEMAVGLCAGLAAGVFRAGWIGGIIAGVVALIVGVWTEWHFIGAMAADPSLGYFIRHFTELGSMKLLIHGISVAMAVWLGARR